MFCKYCGNQMDDDAVFCAKCGKSIGNQPKPSPKTSAPTGSTQRKFIVQRKKHLFGCAVQLAVMIDELERGRVSNGAKIIIPISTDAHALNLKQDNFAGHFETRTYVIPAGSGDVYGYVEPTMFNDKWIVSLECM